MSISRRQFVSGITAAGAGVALPGEAFGLAHQKRPGSATLVLHNGPILTLDRRFSVVDALAIRDGRVLHAGTAASMRHLIGRRTEVVNLRGRTALPGLNDSHLHGASFGLALPPFTYDVGYPAAQSIADMVRIVEDAVRAAEPGDWIRGRGWNANFFPEGRRPTRHDLDPVSPDNPVRLTDFSNHAIVVNSRALELAGVTRDTVPPPGGTIVKDADGEPTGELLETAQSLVAAPPFTRDETKAALNHAITLIHAEGITSFTDPGINRGQFELYAEKLRAGTLKQRVTALWSTGGSVAATRQFLAEYEPPEEIDPRFLNAPGVKVRADGVAASRTSWMYPPGYVDGTGTGSLVVEGDTDEERVATLEEIGAVTARLTLTSEDGPHRRLRSEGRICGVGSGSFG